MQPGPGITIYEDGVRPTIIKTDSDSQPTKRTDSGSGNSWAFTPEPPVCIPVEVDSVVVDPFDDPLELGESYTFSTFGLSGTTPYFYQWYLNGVLVGTAATFVHVLVDSDVQNKDEFGLGTVFIYVVVSNPCGIDSTSTTGGYAAQGDPP